MDVLLIRDKFGVERRVELVPGDDALAALPSHCEVWELLQALNLEEQVGLLALVMEQPALRRVVSQILEVLKLFGTTIGTLQYCQVLLENATNLREAEITKVAILQHQALNLHAELQSQRDLITMQAATITELQQQLEIQSQQNMALPHLDLGVLDEGPQSAAAREQSAALALARSRQAEAERNVQEMAAAAAAARQEKAELEARLRQQENIYATDTAWLTAQTQEAERNAQEMAAAAAAVRQEKAAMQAHMMEQQEIYSNHIACMTTQTKQLWQESQVKTDIAAVAQRERNVLEMHVEDQQDLYDREMTKLTTEKEEVQAAAAAAVGLANAQAQTSRQLQERLRETEGSRDSLIVATTLETVARAEAERRAAEREAADGTQIAMHTSFAFVQNEPLEAEEAEREILPSRLPMTDEQHSRQSVAADLAPAVADAIQRPIAPADPPAAASSSAGGASAGAPVQNASQMPGGLTGAVIFGAAFVAAVGQVAVKLGAEAVQHLCKSAASTLVMAH